MRANRSSWLGANGKWLAAAAAVVMVGAILLMTGSSGGAPAAARRPPSGSGAVVAAEGSPSTGVVSNTARDPESTVPRTAPDDPAAGYSWSVTETAGDGSTIALRLMVGTPEHLRNNLTNGTLTAGTGCTDIDAGTDAVIPATVTATNETPGGANSEAGYRLEIGADWNEAEAESDYASGSVCNSDGSTGTDWSSPLGPQEREYSYLFFVLHDYYTADHPDGDPSVLSSATVSFAEIQVPGTNGSKGPDLTPGDPTGPDVLGETIPLGG